MPVSDLSPEKLTDMYRRMQTIRRFEEEAADLFRKGQIYGVVHSSVGQEAVPVGACAALTSDDYITSTHRGHGHILGKGAEPDRMMAELLGKATGYCKGKGGSMHVARMDLGILGANGIVGGGIGIATGAAFTSQYTESGNVAVCFHGEGAIQQGVFHECANMAALWKLPVIYLCEYNHFAEFTHSRDTFPIQDLTLRTVPYGFQGQEVDGNDVIAVYETVRDAVKKARDGGGPSLIVAVTYRMKGHWEGDPLNYRTNEGVEEWAKKDPIQRLRARLEDAGVFSEGDADRINDEVDQTIKDAVQFAVDSPVPNIDEVTTDVYL